MLLAICSLRAAKVRFPSLALIAQAVARRGSSDRLMRLRFCELHIEVDRVQPWELDGEIVGDTTELTVSAQPGRLLLRLPPSAAGDRQWAAGEMTGAGEPAAT